MTLDPVALVVKNLPENAGDTRDLVSILGLGRSLEQEMATYSSILGWKIPWTEEPGGLQSTWLQGVRHDLAIEYKCMVCVPDSLVIRETAYYHHRKVGFKKCNNVSDTVL